jgi:hypothetical protein
MCENKNFEFLFGPIIYQCSYTKRLKNVKRVFDF